MLMGVGSQLADYGESFRRPGWVCALWFHDGDVKDELTLCYSFELNATLYQVRLPHTHDI